MSQYTPIGLPSPVINVSRKPLVSRGSYTISAKTGDTVGTQEVYNDLDPIDETYNDYYGVPLSDSPNSNGLRSQTSRRPTFHRSSTTRSSVLSRVSTLWDYGVSHAKLAKLASPWEHAPLEKNTTLPDDIAGTVRVFNHRRQRRRLFLNSTFQWLITVVLCGILAALLAGFQRFEWLTKSQRHTFNALVTMLSLLIGLNLAASLRGFAQLLRWRFLAAQYRGLQEFQMVFKCESQMECLRLLWAARTRGRIMPNMTQLLAFTSLFVNVGLQVATAMVGLTYSMDVSSSWVMNQYGTVSVVDLSIIQDKFGISDPTIQEQTLLANEYGISGTNYDSILGTLDDTTHGDQGEIFNSQDGTMYWYRFLDQSLDGQESEVSSRNVISNTTCTNLTVLQGGFSGYSPIDPKVQYRDASGKTHWLNFIDVTNEATGSTSYMVNNTQCGPRCADIFALIGANNASDTLDPSVPWPLLYHCQNTISQVTNADQYINSSAYLMPDSVAGLFAGAIGWSGITQDESTAQVHLYGDGSYWAQSYEFNDGTPVDNSQAAADHMAQIIMQFSAGAIAALDDLGPRIEISGYFPVQAQVVDVQWGFTIATLTSIAGVHLVLLACVIAWANRAIIKDDSALSTARLFRPIVDKLGDHGCLLTGDEIAERFGNVKVIYGVRTPHDFTEEMGVRHVDILEADEGLGRQGMMPPGRYDGSGRPDGRRRGERRKSV